MDTSIGSTAPDVFLRKYHRDLSKALQFATTYNGSDPFITVPGAKYVIYIQKILVNITTSAARTLTVQDDGSSPRVFATVPSAPGVGILEFDFGAEGMAAQVGENIDIAVSGTGLAGWIEISAYARIPPTEGVVPADL